MFIKKYIKEPFEYAMSDWKKILIGGIFGMVYLLPTKLLGVIIQSQNINLRAEEYLSIDLIMSIIGVYAIIIILSIVFKSIQYGYYMKVAKNTIESYDNTNNTNNNLPEWEELGNIFKTGILYFIGSILLALVVFLPFIAIAGLIGYGIYITAGVVLLMPYWFVAIGLYFILAIVYMLYFYLASVNFAKKGFKGFFEFKKVIGLMSLKYVALVILMMIILVTLSFIASLPSLILNFSGIMLDNNGLLLIISAIICSILVSIVSFFSSVALYRSLSIYYSEKTR